MPEKNFDIAQLLVGSENTLVTVLGARLQLVRRPAASALVLLGFDDITAAADASRSSSPTAPPPSKASTIGSPNSNTAGASPSRPCSNCPTAVPG